MGSEMCIRDRPYLVRRIDRILGEKLMKRLSPWGLVTEREVYIAGRKNIAYDVGGITQLDYLNLYKKFTYTNQDTFEVNQNFNMRTVVKHIDYKLITHQEKQ